MEGFPRTVLLVVLAIAGAAQSACGQGLPAEAVNAAPDAHLCKDPQFEYGQPHKVIDSLGWVFGIPKKIILWDRRAVNHRVTAETEENLSQYLGANGMASTKIRINEYDPVGEWRRLGANKEVGAGWRYTVGAFDMLGYTLLPGRLLGVDEYNPYTDSVYIYSDIPCLAEEQAAYAKLVHQHQHPGTYAVLTSLPVVRLWPEKQAKADVLDYTLASGTPAQQCEATHVLFAEFGAEVGRQASVFLGAGPPLTLAGAGVGHAAAHYKANESAQLPPERVDAESPASQVAEATAATLKR
jgi:hypothetical protein